MVATTPVEASISGNPCKHKIISKLFIYRAPAKLRLYTHLCQPFLYISCSLRQVKTNLRTSVEIVPVV